MFALLALATSALALTIRPQGAQHLCVTHQYGDQPNGYSGSPLVLRDCVANNTFSWDGNKLRMHNAHQMSYNPTNGAYAEMYGCSEPGTAWSHDAGSGQLRGQNPSFCLDVTDGRMQAETIVQIWECHDGCHKDYRNQQWVLS